MGVSAEKLFSAALIAEVSIDLQKEKLTPPVWESVNAIDDEVVAVAVIDTIESIVIANYKALTAIGEDGEAAYYAGAELMRAVLKKLKKRRPYLGVAATGESLKRMKAEDIDQINRN